MNTNDVVPNVMDKIDHNARYFVVNIISPDFLILNSLNNRRALNKNNIKDMEDNEIQIFGGVMIVLVEDILVLERQRFLGSRVSFTIHLDLHHIQNQNII